MTGLPDGLILEGVSKQYGPIAALRPIDLALSSGTFTLIVGANGSGKTTLLRLVAGLCRPTRGRVLVRGAEPARAKGDIGFVSHHRCSMTI